MSQFINREQMKTLRILFPLVLLLLQVACGGNSNEEAGYSPFFSKDNSLLAAEVIDQNFGIKFHPPIGWNFMDASLSQKIESRGRATAQGEKQYFYNPVYLFFNDSTGSLLSIGEITYSDSTTDSKKVLNGYKNFISNKYKQDKLSISAFVKDGINFSEFRSGRGNFMNYKLVFEGRPGKIILFDCTIPIEKNKDQIRFYRSSIGSISTKLN